MHDEVKVSVIMPVYNVAPYLKYSLESLIHQSLKEIEIICVDDGSVDDSANVLRKYAIEDNRITVLTHEKNCGIGAARNTGVRMASGEYIIHLDPDDFFDYEMLDLMYKKAKSFDVDVDVVICDYYQYDNISKKKYEMKLPLWFTKRWEKDRFLSQRNNKRYMLAVLPHANWIKLIKRELIEEKNFFHQEINLGEDILYGSKVLMSANSVVYMGKEIRGLVNYRVNNATQSTAGVDKEYMSPYLAYKRLGKVIENVERYHAFRPAMFYFVNKYFYRYMRILSSKKRDEFYQYIKDNLFNDFMFDDYKKEDFYNTEHYKNLKEFLTDNFTYKRMECCTELYSQSVIEALGDSGFKCVLWGIGFNGLAFYEVCKKYKYKLYGIVDENDRKLGGKIDEYVIEKFPEIARDYDAFIVTNPSIVNDVLNKIKVFGLDIPVIDITSFNMFDISFKECVHMINY